MSDNINIFPKSVSNEQKISKGLSAYDVDFNADSTILKGVIADLRAREAKGIETYGTTLETAQLSELELLQLQYEEILDLAMYTRAIIEKKTNEARADHGIVG